MNKLNTIMALVLSFVSARMILMLLNLRGDTILDHLLAFSIGMMCAAACLYIMGKDWKNNQQ